MQEFFLCQCLDINSFGPVRLSGPYYVVIPFGMNPIVCLCTEGQHMIGKEMEFFLGTHPCPNFRWIIQHLIHPVPHFLREPTLYINMIYGAVTKTCFLATEALHNLTELF